MTNKPMSGIDTYNKHYYNRLKPYPSTGMSGLFNFFTAQPEMTAGQVYYKNYYDMISAPDRQFTVEQGAFHKGALQKAQSENLITAEQYKTLADMIDARTVKAITLKQPPLRVTAPKDTILQTAVSNTISSTAKTLDPVNIITGYIGTHKPFFITVGIIAGVGLLAYLTGNVKELVKAIKEK